MLVTDFTRNCLAARRQRKILEGKGYIRHETDWEIHRGGKQDDIIVDAVISTCGKYVYTKVGELKEQEK